MPEVDDQKALALLVAEIRRCRRCVDAPVGAPLPHEPRPVLQVDHRARIGVFGQAPGLKVHQAGKPFMDPSGVRLRAWMGIGEDVFYDASRVAVVPMGFCFPGYNERGGDLPPRRECAPVWRDRVMSQLPNLELALLVGQYAQKWHLGAMRQRTLTETVSAWREVLTREGRPKLVPLPHPSWRNNSWITRNTWFEAELLPELRRLVREALSGTALVR